MDSKGRTSGSYLDDDSIHEDNPLMSQNTGAKRPVTRRWLNGRTIFTTLNLALFLTGISVWSQVAMLVKTKNLSCKAIANSAGEADLAYDSRVVFQPNWPLVDPPTNETNELWNRLSPPGEGVIELPNEATVGLPPSKPSTKRPLTHTVYGVSVFHQLHCVNLLRLNMYPEEFSWTLTDKTPEEIRMHRDHCIDYLRQAIMCNADVTFEPWTKHGINGMDAIHQCRDYNKIFTWAYEQRMDKEKDVIDPL
ncbi:hypothetical protein CB0940_04093 [Cercospora beticola]|uniref:Oxidase ustYa n=1 Tax=Cercospora beticola TaxID=122368 RepID=A0A2G5HJ09_CERBT|nr:hypothetical protein CB0940_04093 [Cercospora beticola]PIA92547.1 hypothetical protein CB0940_04093 [Cercospora beticola]WPB01304.1 hypothetical protein RHO25_005928 [Cercospora beticola]